MTRIWSVALATLKEAIRHRILYLLLVFALMLIIGSRLLTQLTVGETAKIIKDVGLSAISLFGVMITLFVGVGIIFRDLERRTVQVTLSGPVARWEYLIGKYLGVAFAVTINTVVMGLTLSLALWAKAAFEPMILVAVFMLWIELLFITATAVFFSSFSTPIFAVLFTAATYVVGHLAWSLPLLEEKFPESLTRKAIHLVYLIIPDLEYGAIQAQVVAGLTVPASRLLLSCGYLLAYSAILLLIGCVAFRRRDLV